MYQPTSAITKIASLKKPTRVIQGGQGAGKTIGIEIILINHALHNPNRQITIFQAELSKLKKTAVRDFIKILVSYSIFDRNSWNKTDSVYTFHNGSYIEFLGLDKADVGKGLRRDIVYFNELNKGGITLDTYMQISSRATITYADFNPDRRFWLHDEIIPDDETDFITLTFNDNEYLPTAEVRQILKYREKGFYRWEGLAIDELFREDNIKSKYWANKWRVYGLGMVGALDGIILDNWEIVENMPSQAKYLGSGMDFGYTNDPTTLVDVYEYNGIRIFKESLYRTGMINSDIAKHILNVDFKRLVYADSAEPKSIEEIRRHGVRILGADKGRDSIVYGLDLLQENKFYVTKKSVNIINELQSYTWDTDKDGNTINVPINTHNHTIDAMRYFAMMRLKTNSGRYAIR